MYRCQKSSVVDLWLLLQINARRRQQAAEALLQQRLWLHAHPRRVVRPIGRHDDRIRSDHVVSGHLRLLLLLQKTAAVIAVQVHVVMLLLLLLLLQMLLMELLLLVLLLHELVLLLQQLIVLHLLVHLLLLLVLVLFEKTVAVMLLMVVLLLMVLRWRCLHTATAAAAIRHGRLYVMRRSGRRNRRGQRR